MMKKIFLWSLFLIINYSLLITNCYSQLPPRYYWRVLTSPVQANLNSIDGNFIAGNNGTLLKSSSNYSFVFIPGLLNIDLNYIMFDESYSIGKYTIVGNNGTIYYFSNPDNPNFILESSNTTANLFGVSINREVLSLPVFRRIAVGAGGTILKSTWNIGSNWSAWSSVLSGTTQDLLSVDFYPNNYYLNPTGCIAGNNGIILRTTNWGDNWNIINAGVTNKLNCIRFSDSVTCWITGSNGLIMKSTNRGLNWIIIPSGTNVDLKSFFPYLICGSGGTILESKDTGATWQPTPSNVQYNLNSVVYPFVVGNSGTILRRDIDSSFLFKKLEGNNISSFFISSGIFDQNTRNTNAPGFEWPKGSGKTAIFTAGLSIAAYYQGQLREAMASYKGEFVLGKCNNGIPFTNDTFKIFSMKRGDGPSTNSDWLNWGLMVPYGAPFVDINNNGIYDPQIDTPGVKNASQTIFMCYTDGFAYSHNFGEGFGGGLQPLFSEIHLTAWSYSQLSYANLQFLKYVIINKGTQPWTKTFFSLISDTELGDASDDYVGCDTIRKLGFCYNGDNDDPVYGIAPPAVGFILLKGAYNKYSNPPKQLDISSFIPFFGSAVGSPCESDPNGEPYPAYLMMQGYKKDSTCWLDPTQLITPPNYYKKTKFVWTGDPETDNGWTAAKGTIFNCNKDSSGTIIVPAPKADCRLVISSGAENLTVMPGDTQVIVICQLIAKGSSNLNSVTKLKQLADVAIEFYNSGYVIGINKVGKEVPTSFRLGQNYPNPFNPTTKIKFDLRAGVRSQESEVKLVIYDILGREIQTLVNEKLNPGTYEVTFDGSNLPSGIYFYQLRAGDYINSKKFILLK